MLLLLHTRFHLISLKAKADQNDASEDAKDANTNARKEEGSLHTGMASSDLSIVSGNPIQTMKSRFVIGEGMSKSLQTRAKLLGRNRALLLQLYTDR